MLRHARKCSVAYVAVAAVLAFVGKTSAADMSSSVTERARPEYDAVGVPLGGFLLYPKLAMAAEYNDNIYAAGTGAEGDLIARFQPGLRLSRDWGRDAVTLSAFSSINRYWDHGSENTETYGARANGVYNIADAGEIRGDVSFRHDILERESYLSSRRTVSPVNFNEGSAHIQARYGIGDLRLTGFADWLRTAYQNGVAPDGTAVFKKDLSQETISRGLRADYGLSPDTSLFVSGRFFDTGYMTKPPQVPLDRASDGYEVTGGISLHVTDVLSGDVGVGYLKAHYPHIGGQDVDTLALHVELTWSPTLLTTVKVRVARRIEEAPADISSGFLVTRYHLEVDHELRRNVILSAAADYSNGAFRVVDRRDREWNANVSAAYLLNPSMNAKLSYRFRTRESSGLDRGQDFSSNTVMLAFVLQR